MLNLGIALGGGLFFLSFTINEIVFAQYFVIIIFILIIIVILLCNMGLNCNFWRQTYPFMPKYNCCFLMSSSSIYSHHLVPLAPHIEDDRALADLVGDDEKGGGRVDRTLRRVAPAHVIVHDLCATSTFHAKLFEGFCLKIFQFRDFNRIGSSAISELKGRTFFSSSRVKNSLAKWSQL